MLALRTVLAAAMVLLGAAVVVRMFVLMPASGVAIVPGLVLGAAMIALGAHRLSLIARVRGTR